MDTNVEVVHPDDDLSEILSRMDERHLYSMPVVANNRFIGLISKATLLDKISQRTNGSDQPIKPLRDFIQPKNKACCKKPHFMVL